MVEIHRHLEENAYNVELAVDCILTENARQAGRNIIYLIRVLLTHYRCLCLSHNNIDRH